MLTEQQLTGLDLPCEVLFIDALHDESGVFTKAHLCLEEDFKEFLKEAFQILCTTKVKQRRLMAGGGFHPFQRILGECEHPLAQAMVGHHLPEATDLNGLLNGMVVSIRRSQRKDPVPHAMRRLAKAKQTLELMFAIYSSM